MRVVEARVVEASVSRSTSCQLAPPSVFYRHFADEADPYRFVAHRPATALTVAGESAVVGKHVSRLTTDVLRAVGRDTLAAHLTDLLWSGARSAPRGRSSPE